MSALQVAETLAAIVLIFFLPGFALARAVFPELRFRGPRSALHSLELVSLSFVLSVALTVLVGYVLLASAPGGFRAYWSDPVLEAILAGIAAAGLIAAGIRGGFSREVPAPSPSTEEPDHDPFRLLRDLERLSREERRLLHRLRSAPSTGPGRSDIESELERVRDERAALIARREAEFVR